MKYHSCLFKVEVTRNENQNLKKPLVSRSFPLLHHYCTVRSGERRWRKEVNIVSVHPQSRSVYPHLWPPVPATHWDFTWELMTALTNRVCIHSGIYFPSWSP